MRIVANRRKEALFLAHSTRRCGSITLTGDDFHLAGASMHQDIEYSVRLDLYNKNAPLFNKLISFGAMNENLEWLFPVRIIDTEFHLRTLQVEALLKCNLSCSYCYCSAGSKRTELLTQELLFDIFEQAEQMGVISIDFTGGEFLLYPGWEMLLEEVRRRHLNFSVHTNASLLSDRTISFLVSMGVKHLQISADSHIAEIHNGVRGSPKSFDRLVSALEILNKRGIPVYLNLMCHKESIQNIESSYHYFRSLGAIVIVDWIAPFGSEREAELGITVDQFVSATQHFLGRSSQLEEMPPCGRDLGYEMADYEPDCGVGNSYAFLTANGELAICPTLTSREDASLFAGRNVKDVGLKNAWEYGHVFDRYRFFNCKNVETCPTGTLCRGGCRATAYAHYGDPAAPDPVSCNRWKNSTDEYVEFDERYRHGNYDPV